MSQIPLRQRGFLISSTITPIRVTHRLDLQVFFSVEGELADGDPCDGPGELQMMQVGSPISIPSCCCTIPSLDLPPCKLDLTDWMPKE